LREVEGRKVSGCSTHHQETNADEAQGDPRGSPSATPLTGARTGTVDRESGAWLFRVPRCTHQRHEARVFPQRRHSFVATCAPTSEPALERHVGADVPTGRTLDPSHACSPPISLGPL
jgi:hypothetical protein